MTTKGNLPPELESKLEQKATEYAKKLGILSLKLNVQGQIGWPDRIYLYNGRVLFIEFKRPGEKPRKVQLYVHEKIRAQGFNVVATDDLHTARAALEYLRR